MSAVPWNMTAAKNQTLGREELRRQLIFLISHGLAELTFVGIAVFSEAFLQEDQGIIIVASSTGGTIRSRISVAGRLILKVRWCRRRRRADHRGPG